VKPSGYQEIEHTADWALRVWAPNFADLCRQAAAGMVSLTGSVLAPEPTSKREIHLDAADPESLLVVWLEEILYDLESHGLAPSEMHLRTEGDTRLRGTIVQHSLLRPGKTIKAVTYNDLHIQRSSDGCEATIVFDV
jgi:SHS2 domain-containing protein